MVSSNSSSTMNKKGIIAFEMVIWIPRIIFFVVVLVVIFAMISILTKVSVQTGAAEAEVAFQTIIFSPLTTALDIWTGRSYPTIIDIEKFDLTRLDIKLPTKACILFNETKVCSYAERDKYEALRPLAGITGGPTLQEKEIPILVANQSRTTPAILKVEFVYKE